MIPFSSCDVHGFFHFSESYLIGIKTPGEYQLDFLCSMTQVCGILTKGSYCQVIEGTSEHCQIASNV